MFDATATLENFLNAAAARQPAPGGGSVTALVGALAASMGEMTLNYSVGKKGLEAHEPALRAALAELHRARTVLLELMVEDQAAFEELTAARKLPHGPDRDDRVAAGVRACISVPQAIAATGPAILGTCDRVVGIVNRYLLSDLAVCAELAMATTRCAIYNVRVNLPEVTNPAEREAIETTVGHILQRALELIQRIPPEISARQAAGA